VARAAKQWRKGLLDVSRNNRLLYYRPTSTTVDLSEAAPPAMAELLAGNPVSLPRLFPDSPAQAKAGTALRKLAAKQQEAAEEFGVDIAYLALGMVTWTTNPAELEPASPVDETAAAQMLGEDTRRPAGPSEPNAPLLLRGLSITTRPGGTAIELRLTGEAQLNTVLLHVLAHQGVRVDEQELLEAGDDTGGDVTGLGEALAKAARDIPGFVVRDAALFGAFTYLKQPMVDDLDEVDALAASDLVAALANDHDALDSVRSLAGDVSATQVDYSPVDAEYLILDADASQSYVVNAALAGRNLVVQGPPGTGKSQTIANLIACLIADGRSVLFVAQKRAAITAVLDRLTTVGLGDLCLDLFAATSSRRYVADQLARVLDAQDEVRRPDTRRLHEQLTASRDQLVRHSDALDRPRAAGLSLLDCFSLAAGLPPGVRVPLRIPLDVSVGWPVGELDRLADAVNELASRGGLDPQREQRPGWSVNALTTSERVGAGNRALDAVRGRLLPDATDAFAVLARELGVPALDRPSDATTVLNELTELDRLLAAAPTLFCSADGSPSPVSDDDLELLLCATDKRYAKQRGRKPGFGDRRRARRRAAELVPEVTGQGLHELLRAAQTARMTWARGGYAGPPRVSATYPRAVGAVTALGAGLVQLGCFVQGVALAELAVSELVAFCDQLGGDRRRGELPRCHELEQQLGAAGAGGLLRWAREHPGAVGAAGELADLLRFAVVHAVIEDALSTDPALASTSGVELTDATTLFRDRDQQHLAANAHRVRRAAAERLAAMLNAHPEQHRLIKREAAKKRNVTAVRKLFGQAPEVLTVASPCWAMSPLQVSRLLPNRACFDVVVFDEASQVRPPDAIPALVRARQVVVAGDSRQLPPTDFFTKVLDGGDGDDDADGEDADVRAEHPDTAPRPPIARPAGGGPLTDGAESILAALDIALAGQSRRLLWHYRSRDERLIAVSNAHVYANSLTTFPTAAGDHVLRHEVVPPSPGVQGVTSPVAEVDKVVELALEHLREHPQRSLGIICFGVKHTTRVKDALDERLAAEPELLDAAEAHAEPLFVKNIERVQGDERDTIIVSVGYGRETDGRVRLFWGPLLRAGGERRLNVAISRARAQMTLVSSFAADDLTHDAHPSAGYQLMYRFFRFMASGGTDLGDDRARDATLNPFELDVRDRLTQAGLDVVPQWGVGRYRIDFAVRHPEHPGRFVLAVEADGAMYHSGHLARERDRLRQQLLEDRGWTFHRIWSTDWFNDADAEVTQVLDSYQFALQVDEIRQTLPDPTEDLSDVLEPGLEQIWDLPDAVRALPRPRFVPGLNIAGYDHPTLVRVVCWVRSDGVARTRDDELTLLMHELGFRRRGTNIVAALTRAQTDARCDQR
jgi:very-short-patch-repair endonuclease